MPQRLIKIILPQSHGPAARVLLEGRETLAFWTEEADGDQAVLSALVDAGRAEELMDHVGASFAGVRGFRLVVLAVEASLPRPERDKPEEDTAVEATEPDDPHAPDEAEDPKAKPRKSRTPLRVSREELYTGVSDATQPTLIFGAMVVLSTVVAAIGLLQDNVAVIIGAMVIAPLLGPNVALALSFALADFDLARQALKALPAGVGLAFVLSFGLGLAVEVDPAGAQIAARTEVGLPAIALALASGCAGVLAFTTGLSAALIGVMVAVALLPPLATCGLLLGAGHTEPALGALLLLAVNVICVNLAGVATFVIQGIRPATWWEADRARRASRIALVIWTIVLAVLVGLVLLARGG